MRCMRDHWCWRPGWRLGRRLYAWHLTFEDQPELHRMVRGCQSWLGVPGLDVVPVEWLHVTMQRVGFTDEVDEADVQRIAAAATRRCAQLAPLAVTLGPALVWSEGVVLQLVPAEPVGQVRAALREAIAEVWGADRVPEPGRRLHTACQHRLQQCGSPAAPLVEIVEGLSPAAVAVTIPAARLIVVGRDTHVYRWHPRDGAAGSGRPSQRVT
jgi:hypothetical protein